MYERRSSLEIVCAQGNRTSASSKHGQDDGQQLLGGERRRIRTPKRLIAEIAGDERSSPGKP